MLPKSSADVAVAESTPLSVVVSASFSGAAQPAAAARVASTASDASVLRVFTGILQGSSTEIGDVVQGGASRVPSDRRLLPNGL